MKHSILLVREDGSRAEFSVRPGQSLLSASEQCLQKAIDVGCRGGGCGLCRVRVIRGNYDAKVMSKAHIGEAERAAHIVLACRIFPTSDMEVHTDKPPPFQAA